MNFRPTSIDGLIILEPKVFEDERGYFFESYNCRKLPESMSNITWVQDNESKSKKGVLRGLHYQVAEYAQAKLVRVIQGEVLDVAVDIRPGSKTFGKWHSEILSENNKLQFFIPRGFAHGFLVLSDEAIFSYKCDNYYNKESEGGIIFSDITLDIDWMLHPSELILSEKDLNLPPLQKHRPIF